MHDYFDFLWLVTQASAVQSIFKEAQNLKKLRHKNIVELHHAFLDQKQKELIMIMEYANGGEIIDMLREKGTLNEMDARRIILQITNSINYCHTRGIIHRDLKLENILFRSPQTGENPDLFIKIIDFGIAGVCETGKNDKGNAGTDEYLPPEFFYQKVCESAPGLDVWAIGIIWFALV